MISRMRKSLAQIRVWIECPACGAREKIERQVVLPLEVLSPIIEKTCAVCDRCRGLAVMFFEREATRLH
jgi:hypothetical protein